MNQASPSPAATQPEPRGGARVVRYLPALLVHLLPLAPLSQGHFFATTGALLFVGLTYIKTAKLTAALRELDSFTGERDADSRKMIERMRSQRRFWRNLTFLPRVASV